ncbi:MAG: hypothetical protein ACRD6X_09555, partial [Pyrinomonadaceae bacterium]
MSFFADLITETLKATVIVGSARSQNKTFLIGFGVLTSIVSAVILTYLFSLPPTTLADYSTKEIEYGVATSNSKDGRVVLRSDSDDYSLFKRIWQDSYSREQVVEALNKSKHAKLWLNSP